MRKILKTILICIALAQYFCKIDPIRTYDWISGIWHGIFFIPNFILSIFGDTLYKAAYYTTGYNITWWIMITPITIYILFWAALIIWVFISALQGDN